MTRLHSYIVARDYGFAPNPFYGFCTLATCMVRIRAWAEVGDWIVGTGSKRRDRGGHLVYAMRIDETQSFDEYWDDPRFRAKRPDMYASKVKAFGDNIYHRNNSDGSRHQADSHHSLSDGSPNMNNLRHDTKVDRVLVGRDFVYYGGTGPQVPVFSGVSIIQSGIGHRSSFPAKIIGEFVQWISSLDETGYCGAPSDWN